MELLVATFPVLPYDKLHCRELERCKISSFKFQKSKYNAPFTLLRITNQSLPDIPIDCTIQTDASEQGWGAADGNIPISGRWSSLKRNHINLEN